MNWSIGANAPTRDGLKAALSDRNNEQGGPMAPETLAAVNAAIDLVAEPAGTTITISTTGATDDDGIVEFSFQIRAIAPPSA